MKLFVYASALVSAFKVKIFRFSNRLFANFSDV